VPLAFFLHNFILVTFVLNYLLKLLKS